MFHLHRLFFVLLVLGALAPQAMRGDDHPSDQSVHHSFMKLYAPAERAAVVPQAPPGYVIHPLDRSQSATALTREVFGYFPYWFRTRWAQLDYQLLSTIAYFSGEVNANGSIGDTHGWPKYPGDPSAAADVVSMINAAHATGVRVVLCFTNFASSDIQALVSTPSYRTTFIEQSLAIVKAGGGDGININFEGINSGDRDALTTFMQVLADSFHTRIPGSQVSCAPTDYDTRAGDWDLQALNSSVDLFFFQGYGYGWSGTSTTRPVGLLPNTSFWGSLNETSLINFVLARIPPGKVVLGVPHYGYRWPAVSGDPKAQTEGTGVVTYYPDALGYVSTHGRLWDQAALNPWFRYQVGAQWYQGWYDDPESMSHKYQFVLDRNLMGVGMWALGMDAGNHDIWDILADYLTDSGQVPRPPSAPVLEVVKDTSAAAEARLMVRWKSAGEDFLGGFRLYLSTNPDVWPASPHLDETVLTAERRSALLGTLVSNTSYFVKMVAVDSSRVRSSDTSDTYGACTGEGQRYLVVDGFDRTTGSYTLPSHDFGARYGASIGSNARLFDGADNDAVQQGVVSLASYAGVFWFLGDESVADRSLNTIEQSLIQDYLNSGGRLFITGSEIGYDLGRSASPNYAPGFYAGYLKADYAGDKASTITYSGVPGSLFDGESGSFGQVYPEDWPDYITPTGGSIAALRYSASEIAAVQYAGPFGAGTASGKLVNVAFAMETIGLSATRDRLIGKVLGFFEGALAVDASSGTPVAWALEQNYPNPFNPGTTIRFSIGTGVHAMRDGTESSGSDNKGGQGAVVRLAVYDILGREVAVLVNEKKAPGTYDVVFDGSGVASGVYVYRLQVGGPDSPSSGGSTSGADGFTATRLMTLIR